MSNIPRTITFTIPESYSNVSNRIDAIRALRCCLDFPISKAKDLSETPGTYTFHVRVQDEYDQDTGQTVSAEFRFSEAVAVLEAVGVVLQHAYKVRSNALEAIRHYACEATRESDYEFADALLAVLRRFS